MTKEVERPERRRKPLDESLPRMTGYEIAEYVAVALSGGVRPTSEALRRAVGNALRERRSDREEP